MQAYFNSYQWNGNNEVWSLYILVSCIDLDIKIIVMFFVDFGWVIFSLYYYYMPILRLYTDFGPSLYAETCKRVCMVGGVGSLILF